MFLRAAVRQTIAVEIKRYLTHDETRSPLSGLGFGNGEIRGVGAPTYVVTYEKSLVDDQDLEHLFSLSRGQPVESWRKRR